VALDNEQIGGAHLPIDETKDALFGQTVRSHA
jgi:hypothetical protein